MSDTPTEFNSNDVVDITSTRVLELITKRTPDGLKKLNIRTLQEQIMDESFILQARQTVAHVLLTVQPERISLDMTETGFMSAAMLGVVVQLKNYLQQTRAPLMQVVGVQPAIMEVLKITNLHKCMVFGERAK